MQFSTHPQEDTHGDVIVITSFCCFFSWYCTPTDMLCFMRAARHTHYLCRYTLVVANSDLARSSPSSQGGALRTIDIQ